MATEGIDVSVWQANTPPLTGLAFLFARASYGSTVDPRYAQHTGNARAAGLVVGAYHFGTSEPVVDQVAAYVSVIRGANLFVLDYESEQGRQRMSPTQAREFIRAIQARGLRVGLYASESGFPSLGQDWNWVANWSARPTIPWSFWQYQGSPLDRDRFNGAATELVAFAQAKPSAGGIVPGTIWSTDVPPDVRAVDPTGQRVGAAIHKAFPERPKPYGAVINGVDLVAVLARRKIDPRTSGGYAGAVRKLLAWAKV